MLDGRDFLVHVVAVGAAFASGQEAQRIATVAPDLIGVALAADGDLGLGGQGLGEGDQAWLIVFIASVFEAGPVAGLTSQELLCCHDRGVMAQSDGLGFAFVAVLTLLPAQVCSLPGEGRCRILRPMVCLRPFAQ